LKPPRVKICCIADEAEARLAVQQGAAALGLVSAMPSGPGVIDDATVARVAAAVRGEPVRTFLLTARTQADDIAAQHAAAGTTTLQLVDHVPLAELRRLRGLCPGVELVQVIHVTGESALAEAVAVAPWVDALLLDSGNPAAAVKQLGGTGRTHDWALAGRIRAAVAPRPLWLAGGLRPHNVAEAIATVQPFGLDLCTGVRLQGRLHGPTLAAFMQAVAASAEAPPTSTRKPFG
jgi:phosphoribosylanthranilate isomerase